MLFAEWTFPITLPALSEADVSFFDYEATITGWGFDERGERTGSYPDTLRCVRRRVVTQLSCYLRYGDFLQETNICTWGTYNGDACTGDTGSPLVARIDRYTLKLIGIVSYGAFAFGESCTDGRGTVHTRVSKYLDWIEKNSDVRIQE